LNIASYSVADAYMPFSARQYNQRTLEVDGRDKLTFKMKKDGFMDGTTFESQRGELQFSLPRP
jgi:hypothetical protein